MCTFVPSKTAWGMGLCVSEGLLSPLIQCDCEEMVQR